MAARLTATFVRTRGAPDRIYVHRSDGSETGWPFPTYGEELPHDLIHLVVEAAFGLEKGFWGRVDSGVDPTRVNADANRRGGKDKYAAFGADHGQLLLAEALANARWSDRGASDEDRREAVAVECSKVGVEIPPQVTIEQIARVRRVLERLRDRWRALAAKGSLRLVFDAAAPGPSFEELERPATREE